MWNIPGDELETSMVWADRFRHAYTKADEKSADARAARLRSDEVRGPHARQGHRVPGLSRSAAGTRCGTRWSRAPRSCATASSASSDEHKQPYVLTASGEKYYFADYHTVFCSIDIDELWGENTLPYTGRMMIPLLIPGLAHAFPEGAESLHYSSCEFQTRVTEMKVITRHDSPDTLILIEVPVLPGRRGDVSAQHHRLRARAEPVRRKGVPAAVGAGVRDLRAIRRARQEDSRTCATSGATRSSNTGACPRRSTPPT